MFDGEAVIAAGRYILRDFMVAIFDDSNPDASWLDAEGYACSANFVLDVQTNQLLGRKWVILNDASTHVKTRPEAKMLKILDFMPDTNNKKTCISP